MARDIKGKMDRKMVSFVMHLVSYIALRAVRLLHGVTGLTAVE